MNELLHINDIFHTVQGEGFHGGRRALFVRMPFCNLKCSWCDTEYNSFKKMSADEIKEFAMKEPTRLAVITGGEPNLNKDTPRVIEILKSLGFYITCETNGTVPIVDGIDFVTVSPKQASKDKGLPPWHICEDAMAKASEFKYVVEFGFDWRVLDRHDVKDGRHYFLSPEFNRFGCSVEEMVKFVAARPDWKISLQTHKWMGIA